MYKMKKILILIGLLIPLIGFSQRFSKRLDQIDAPSDTFSIIIDDTVRYEFRKDTFSAPNVYFYFSNKDEGGVNNLTDSTLMLVNSNSDSIKIQLDTTYFDSTVVKVKMLQIGAGDILTSSDTVNINDVVYDDTLLFNTVNWVQYSSDSTVVFNKSWARQYKIGGK